MSGIFGRGTYKPLPLHAPSPRVSNFVTHSFATGSQVKHHYSGTNCHSCLTYIASQLPLDTSSQNEEKMQTPQCRELGGGRFRSNGALVSRKWAKSRETKRLPASLPSHAAVTLARKWEASPKRGQAPDEKNPIMLPFPT